MSEWNCPVCRKGPLRPAQKIRVFAPHGQRLEVLLETSVCEHCGETTTLASQHKENLQRLAARKVQYGSVLMGEEILALRKRYGLTQQQASLVFGKGKIAFSRYESETTYPDESTTLLLTLAMERPEVMKSLADKAGVSLPLWPERCEDEQRAKVRTIWAVPPANMRTQSLRLDMTAPKGTGNMHLPSRQAPVHALFRSNFAANDGATARKVADQ